MRSGDPIGARPEVKPTAALPHQLVVTGPAVHGLWPWSSWLI